MYPPFTARPLDTLEASGSSLLVPTISFNGLALAASVPAVGNCEMVLSATPIEENAVSLCFDSIEAAFGHPPP
jgi:hypothetical protein